MLTKRKDTYEKTWSLETGADDYVTKPYDGQELKARIGAVLRRYETGNIVLAKAYCLTGIVIDPRTKQQHTICLQWDKQKGRYRVWLNSNEKFLSQAEGKLLRFFMERPDECLSSNTIIESVIGWERGTPDAVKTRIYRLRQALGNRQEKNSEEGNDKTDNLYIRNEPGGGYVFSGSVEPCDSDGC